MPSWYQDHNTTRFPSQIESIASLAIRLAYKICLPSTKVFWDGETIVPITLLTLLAKILYKPDARSPHTDVTHNRMVLESFYNKIWMGQVKMPPSIMEEVIDKSRSWRRHNQVWKPWLISPMIVKTSQSTTKGFINKSRDERSGNFQQVQGFFWRTKDEKTLTFLNP